MALGPGKYDDLCNELRERTGALGVLVMVIEGSQGSGVSVKVDSVGAPELQRRLPDMLQHFAEGMRSEIERDLT